VPNPKDLLERLLRDAVCARAVTLAVARQAIAAGWATAKQRLGPRVSGLAFRVRAGSPGPGGRIMSAAT
jgi:hypothetical protein